MPVSDFFYSLMQGLGVTPPQPQSIAQSRLTRTPMAFMGQPLESGAQGVYTPQQNWGAWAGHPGGLAGIDPSTQGLIRVGPGAPSDTIPHEIIHSATMGDLQPGSTTYKNVQRVIPSEVTDYVNDLYKGHGEYDAVHEGVSWLLTSPLYADKKYNDAKLKMLNAFPAATRAKVTRILGAHQDAQ